MTCIGIAILALICSYIYKVNSELNKKKEWAIMQTIESDNSHTNWKIIREPMGSSLVLLGLKTQDEKTPFVWIVLNKKDEIKIFPSHFKFKLSCGDFDQIRHEYKMKDNIESYLKYKCV